MEPETIRIPARSRRQAMDWGLALLSQEIQGTIVFSEEEGGWGLLINRAECDAAIEVLRQYEAENRPSVWRQEFLDTGLLFDWGALGWVVLVIFFYVLSSVHPGLREVGAVDSTQVFHGQAWRLFTAIWLHADWAHLASNATLGFVFLGLALGSYGTGAGLLGAYLAGAAGNLVACVLSSVEHHSLGASGMVMGAVGLLAARSVAYWRQGAHGRRLVVAGLAGGVLLFVLLGVTPGTDIVAHGGGFAAGVVLGALLAWIPKLAERPRPGLVAMAVFILLTIWPWGLALRSVR